MMKIATSNKFDGPRHMAEVHHRPAVAPLRALKEWTGTTEGEIFGVVEGADPGDTQVLLGYIDEDANAIAPDGETIVERYEFG